MSAPDDPSLAIARVAVLGAGVMGVGIAAHLANAGCRVQLLDQLPTAGGERNALAKAAIAKLGKSDPPALMHQTSAALIEPGNLEDDLAGVAAADWVIEAVVEDLAVKQALLARLAPHLGEAAVVSSNTSTLTLQALAAGLPANLQRRLLVTHFFNPPRYIPLLELVAGPGTDADAVRRVERFAFERLGKTVVRAADRPGFIANRIGAFWLLAALALTLELELTVEEADAVASAAFGVPRTGVFALVDLVGLDLVPRIAASLRAQLPEDDPFNALPPEPPLITRMIEAGQTGRKGKGGFYRLVERDGRRQKEALDLATGDYRPAARVRLEKGPGGGVAALLKRADKLGRFAARLVPETLAYAARVMPEVADDVAAVDRAMRLGYGWAKGPFELLDALGPGAVAERLAAAGSPVPALLREIGGRRFYPRDGGAPAALGRAGGYVRLEPPPGTLRLRDLKDRGAAPVAANRSASLWDLGDGIACLELHTKLNTLDPDGLAMLGEAIARVRDGFAGLVIGNDAAQFSAGVNLGLALYAANLALWPRLEAIVRQGQETLQALKYAPFPVVGAPSGLAVGGGCEILLHCAAVEAHAETYAGLVEVGAGLIPAWGGTTQLLLRHLAKPGRAMGPMPAITKAFETIALAKVARSAAEAKDLLFLRPEDGIVMHRDQVLAKAKARALLLARDYRPPARPVLHLPGKAARLALQLAIEGFRRLGRATAHDAHVVKSLAFVLSGGSTSSRQALDEAALLDLECQAVMALLRSPATLARMEHLLDTGKPLRN